VHVITVKRLQQAVEEHEDAASDLGSWIRIVKTVRWKNFLELRASFADADDVNGMVVFNIRHNRYRLITAVHYAKVIEQRLTLGHVYIGAFLTHKQYDRWCAMTRKQRAEWLQF
jgi:mRNA interferase HigB